MPPGFTSFAHFATYRRRGSERVRRYSAVLRTSIPGKRMNRSTVQRASFAA
jgi:hypothetical protein